ncbi:TPA: hypothetical protein DHW62_02720 [candidate division WWE3 bacterium]|uniref:Uncharacterized protein n=1 Tax=candidate division WWE3 bacterium TaxID=2053526 RepID=A0A656PPX3_UNCKA|nr:MAG: hypothetical protein UU91_C0006G0030 [candidate division WWE3 bacterium GW2011_GWB1_42_117]KKS54665.1 MAG: hypothetical protein UV21_C0005G0029 [candidate division WWE3 bacterium GW2011_GWD2_42_34]KKT04897.1 MAG: hypothetical protein UV83_C0008G0031 [candidate division WWE3 bacterium GW2011_GWE2_43_18]KKT06622.1 MAG: hypothetical protein UV84_C0005G0008 [candidate division WWE3 bacterium GW2011_GWF2_43_18]KKT08344.1 MAG: hypothetical protein UV87_C0004G0034 [candidate division WWE3 bact
MPKFLYTAIFLFVLSSASLAYSLFVLKPSNYTYIFIFLVSLFLFFTGLFSTTGFFLATKTFSKEGDPRGIFRSVLKISAYTSFGIVIFFFLRGFKLVSLFNIFLSLAFYLALGYQLFVYGRKER